MVGTMYPDQQRIRGLLILLTFILWFAGAAAAQAPPGRSRPLQEATGGSPALSTAAAFPEQSQSPLQGSVPSGQASPEVLPLSLNGAIERGLKHNLGLLLSDQASRAARGQRWVALSALLPNLEASATEQVQQLSLAANGIKIPNFPRIVGPFGIFDVRAFLSQRVLDWNATETARAAAENVGAADYSYKDARDLVVLVVSNAYLQTTADAARVGAVRTQVKTAESLHDKAVDLHKAGLSAGIDELRAKVELQTRQQQLIAAENDLAKHKLNLARAIGLPIGQGFALTEQVAFRPLESVQLGDVLQRAYSSRSDYQSALAQVRAAEFARKAAVAERLPTLAVSADYGDIGPNPANSHGTFTVAGVLRVPIFQGGRVRGDVLQADAALQQRKQELENLRAQIDYSVRTALLDLKTAADQVAVAQSSVELAGQTLTQAQDRFGAGVTDNIEVVQAQESVASANDAYIASLYAHNLAKVSLARAMGIAEQGVKEYLGGK